MATLYFIGLGLGDERDITGRAWTLLRGCDRVFAEEYTATLAPGSLERLGTSVGRTITRLSRAEVESERPLIEALEGASKVAFLVVGDPFAATTHVQLRIAAERAGHSWKYIPNASILTAAAGFLGLMHYRFGRTVSVPLPAPGFAPTSPLDRLAENLSEGLHTLLLLDLRPEAGEHLTAAAALTLLRERDASRSPRLLGDERRLAVVARLGTDEANGWYGPLSALQGVDFGPPMHSLVVPAEPLHFEEEAALRRFSLDPGAPTESAGRPT
jgi:diphthine synthase